MCLYVMCNTCLLRIYIHIYIYASLLFDKLYISMKSKHFKCHINVAIPWLQEHVKTNESDYKALIHVSITLKFS